MAQRRLLQIFNQRWHGRLAQLSQTVERGDPHGEISVVERFGQRRHDTIGFRADAVQRQDRHAAHVRIGVAERLGQCRRRGCGSGADQLQGVNRVGPDRGRLVGHGRGQFAHSGLRTRAESAQFVDRLQADLLVGAMELLDQLGDRFVGGAGSRPPHQRQQHQRSPPSPELSRQGSVLHISFALIVESRFSAASRDWLLRGPARKKQRICGTAGGTQSPHYCTPNRPDVYNRSQTFCAPLAREPTIAADYATRGETERR